ncbi:MAG: cytochrome c biogenesis protein ResB [Chloroflexota bacterium]|nr:cytochrome c biogenesis protein ResB [Chloroflexota bacterium]
MMISQTPRDPWRIIWRVVTGDGLPVILLLALAIGLTLTVWLPQMPMGDPIAYAQWLSGARVRFGEATATMRALGLFTITRSLGFRALLALLAGCLSLQLIESGDRLRRNREMAEPEEEWKPLADVTLSDVVDDLRERRYRMLSAPPLFQADRWPWAELFPLLVQGGALLLLIGLLITHLWGWRVEGLILQSGARVTLPDAEKWVALSEDAGRVTHSPGIVTFVEQRGPGAQVSAAGDDGHPLSLQQAFEADPVTQLRLALAEDQYFAIPEAQLIVRLAPQPDSSVLVQVYRSPPGRLATETVMEGDAELTVDDVTLEFTPAPYTRLAATFNPGLWPTVVGLVLLVMGLLGSVMWPARRFWLRQAAGRAEAAGDLPPTLATGEED